MPDGSATVVLVAYRTRSLDLGWLPAGTRVLVVHNDDELDPGSLPDAEHIRNHSNVGFGAAVNQALERVTTDRLVVVNPDAELRPAHWDALAGGSERDVVTVPLIDRDGRPTSVVSAYPTPLSLLLTTWEVGRLARRGGAVRRLLAPLLGRWGRAHAASLETGRAAAWPLSERWVSGAILSVATGRLRDVGGFDPGYFLYFEDVDLCARLAARHTDMRAVVADTPPAVHAVGRQPSDPRAWRPTRPLFQASAQRYAHARTGLRWRVAARLLPGPRFAP